MIDFSILDKIEPHSGISAQERSKIYYVLRELDEDGVSEGLGRAPAPVLSSQEAAPLTDTTLRHTPTSTNTGGALGDEVPPECMSGAIPLVLFLGSPFSNFYPSPMTVDGKQFPTSEHYFMWAKAKTFEDEPMAAKILAAETPEKANSFGRLVNNFDLTVWNEQSIRMMTIACYRKFQQNPALRKALFSTHEKVLVEAAPDDRIWGIGMNATDKHADDPAKWQGTNKLGNILTIIREHMIASCKYEKDKSSPSNCVLM